MSAIQCIGCQNLLKKKEEDKVLWKNHLRNEVERMCKILKEKHALERKELLGKIEELTEKNGILEKESGSNDHQEEEDTRFRKLLENWKAYRCEAERLLHEAMNELKSYNNKSVSQFN